jgi:hypothetical protein
MKQAANNAVVSCVATLRSSRNWQHVPLKHLLAFTGPQGFVSQKIEADTEIKNKEKLYHDENTRVKDLELITVIDILPH